MTWLRRYKTLILILLVLAAWSALFYLVSPEALVTSVGIGNAYAVAFAVSLFAGFSTFTGTAAYATVIEFSRGGVNPLYLGLASGFGLFLSDSAFYLLAMRGRESIENRFRARFQQVQGIVARIPREVIYIGIYLFCAFGPIPNDIILGLLIVGGYRYRRFWPFLLAGDVTFMLFLSYLFQQ